MNNWTCRRRTCKMKHSPSYEIRDSSCEVSVIQIDLQTKGTINPTPPQKYNKTPVGWVFFKPRVFHYRTIVTALVNCTGVPIPGRYTVYTPRFWVASLLQLKILVTGKIVILLHFWKKVFTLRRPNFILPKKSWKKG